MYRVAGKVLDVYDDLKLSLLQENLAKVGSLKLDPIDQIMKLPSDKFALVFLTKTGGTLRKYPIHSADATSVSNLYFEKMAHKLPPEARAVAATFLKKASESFKLSPSKTLEKHATGEFTSNVVDVRKCSDNELTSKPKHLALGEDYPIDTQMQVKTAIAYFDENSRLFEPRHRHLFANAVIKRASALGVGIDKTSSLHKYAGEKYGNLVESAYHERLHAMGGDVQAQKALKHLFEKRASFTPSKFAEALEKLDQASHIDRYWDRGSLGVRDPYRSTFEGIKIASAIKVGNQSVDPAKIQKLAGSEALKRSFDEHFCKAFSESPVEIFQSLPRPEQAVIISMIEGVDG
jgi:hypothetical protein